MSVRMLSIVTVSILALTLTGCHKKKRRKHVHIEPVPITFAYQADTLGETFLDEFVWFNPTADAVVDLEVLDFFGELEIRIEDSLGVEVYYELFSGNGGDLFLKDLTFLGLPGDWVIQVWGTQLDASVDLLVIP